MSREAIAGRLGGARTIFALLAILAVVVGVFSTWTTVGPVTLNGTQGPNNGWLALIVAAFALGWTPSLARGSWIGVVGVFGAALVIAWTAVENWLDNREVLGGSVGWGLVLVVLSSAVLAGAAAATALDRIRLARLPRTRGSGRRPGDPQAPAARN